ncbi:alpha/beta fold hydrolase [Pararhizobium sp.]|uniref:alpha/beta fold hydrolase n=1 Tax=Pararhizobium sp. TaxID=1977563 RepID=UPI00271AD959|nr:alpha/beta fold hydrolase [Pararhizobium sp.]MDO9415675.1 alpha/beta fold hydrolase [Pararhizobium sp.]
MTSSHETAVQPAIFVLVHGAWSGAWSWERLVPLLRAKGHRVYAPALSGLGERSHLDSTLIDLSTHVLDVVNEIRWKDLDRIVLVGHSYSGIVITGVAEEVGDRIASIVYLDAFLPDNGQSFADMVPGWELTGDRIEPPPTEPGDYRREEDRAWVDSKATPQPTKTLTSKLRVTGAYEKIGRKTYIQATGWGRGFAETAERLVARPDWTVLTIASGHDAAIDAPEELAALLETCI